ncbi:MAG: hypothetical protein ABIK93_02840 [candidate division WOR-3 bacterium]
MAKKPNLGFRVPKIEKMRALKKRPKGFLRPTLVHRDEKRYYRPKAKQNFQQAIEEENQ